MSLDLGTHKDSKIEKDQIHFFRNATSPAKAEHSTKPLLNNADIWTIVSVPIKKFFDGVTSNEFILKAYESSSLYK